MNKLDYNKVFPSVQLPEWKTKFIDFLYDEGLLAIRPAKLKSNRRADTFLNVGDANNGARMTQLGRAYASLIDEKFGDQQIDTILGPAYKGIQLAVAASMMLSLDHGRNISYTYDRKEEKAYGEATGAGRADAAKKIFVGHIPKDGDNVLLVDDVLTTGATKEEEITKLMSVAKAKLAGLVIAGDRQELDENGNNPLLELKRKYGFETYAAAKIVSEAVPYLMSKGKIDDNHLRALAAYARTYGTEETKTWCRDLVLVDRERGIIPACDVPLEDAEKIFQATADIDGVVAYKIPAVSGRKGWETWVQTARKYTSKPLIYDHQKAGTDIPDTGREFMKDLKASGFDAVILFPLSGPSTQWEWIHSAFENDMEVFVGGEMTHPRYKVSEGGYINDEAMTRTYVLGAKAGVNNFIVPGNKPDRIAFYKSAIEEAVPGIQPSFGSPGLVAQGGKISDATKVAGKRWFGIVGRGVYFEDPAMRTVENMRKAALEHVSQL